MLTVLYRDENDYITPKGEHKVQWVCKCDCGAIKSIVAGSLLNGRTQACGGHKEAWNKGVHMSETPTYKLFDSCVVGVLQSGVKFIFDLDDYNTISKYTWFLTPNGYLKTGADIGTHRFIHRLIMNVCDDEYVDHINGDKLDNRKCNLRICCNAQNSINCQRKTGVMRGVTFSKKSNKWLAYIVIDGQQKSLGYYINKNDAIDARQKAEEIIYGQYTYLRSQELSKRNEVEKSAYEFYISKG